MERTLGEIEDAIIAALTPLMATLKVRQVAPYSGELDPDRIMEFVKRWPALLVSDEGEDNQDNGSRQMQTTAWVVLVGDHNATDLAKARRGTTGTPGTYAMRLAVRRALLGVQLFPELLPVRYRGTVSQAQAKGLSLYSMHFEMEQPYLL